MLLRLASMSAEEDRQRAAEDRLREEGRIAERIQMRLGDHDDQFKAMRASMNAMNNQIEKIHAENATRWEKFQVAQEAMADKIEQLATQETIRNQTNEGIRKALQDANDKQISTRTFLIGVVGIILTIIGLVLSQAHFFGGGSSGGGVIFFVPHLLGWLS